MLVNPYTPGSKEFNMWEAQKAVAAARRVQELGKGATSELQDLRFGRSKAFADMLASSAGQRKVFGKTLDEMKYMAEGGPIGEMSLLAPAEEFEYEEVSTDLTALMDVLGEEAFAELQVAMEAYPVVAQVAEMATYSADGYVEGEGTSTSDSIPARLSDGEYVFSAEAVEVLGLDNLERMHEQAKIEAAAS